MSRVLVPPSRLFPVQNAALPSPEQRAKLARAAPATALPKTFDWRNPQDRASRAHDVPGFALAPVVDQGTCGNCWACSSTSTLYDRLNVKKNIDGDDALQPWDNVGLSITWLASCDRACQSQQSETCANGCSGADVGTAMRLLESSLTNGFVNQHCMPLLDIDEIKDRRGDFGALSQCQLDASDPTKCRDDLAGCSKCVDGSEGKSNVFVKPGTTVKLHDATEIKQEIFANGPVVGTFQVLEDFEQKFVLPNAFGSTGGVYIEDFNSPSAGWHAVSIVGWGEKDIGGGRVVPYWIARNSWGTHYAQNGYWFHAQQQTGGTPVNLRSGLEGCKALSDAQKSDLSNKGFGDADAEQKMILAGGGIIVFEPELRGTSSSPAPGGGGGGGGASPSPGGSSIWILLALGALLLLGVGLWWYMRRAK